MRVALVSFRFLEFTSAVVGRTGVLSGEACRTHPVGIISDLTAWGIPRKHWPPSLKLMTKKLEWSELLGAEVQQGILKAVQVGNWAIEGVKGDLLRPGPSLAADLSIS